MEMGGWEMDLKVDAHAEGGLEHLAEEDGHLVLVVVEALLRRHSQARVAQDAAADELVQQPYEVCAGGLIFGWRGVWNGGEEGKDAVAEPEDGQCTGGSAVSA